MPKPQTLAAEASQEDDPFFTKSDYLLQGKYPMEAVWHPADQAARKMLENWVTENRVVKGPLNKLVKWLEESQYLGNLAGNKQVTKLTDAKIHRLFEEVCERLGAKPVNLFIDMDPSPNAWAVGGENASIVVTHGLLELMSDEELQFILAHELGHILCNHTRYSILAVQVSAVQAMLGLIPAVGPGLAFLVTLNLLYWYRRSELSADRYGLLAVKKPEVALNALAKLAGGRHDEARESSLRAVRQQAAEFRTLTQSRGVAKSALDIFFGYRKQGISATHPWPAVRVWELEKWQGSQQLGFLRKGQFPEAEKCRFDVEMFFALDLADGEVASPAKVFMADFAGEIYGAAGKAAVVAKEKLIAGKDAAKDKMKAGTVVAKEKIVAGKDVARDKMKAGKEKVKSWLDKEKGR